MSSAAQRYLSLLKKPLLDALYIENEAPQDQGFDRMDIHPILSRADVDDYRVRAGIECPIDPIDHSGVFWRNS